MTERRIAGFTGLLFVVMVAISAFAAGSPPKFDDPIEEIVRFVVEKDSQIVGAAFLMAMAAIPLLVFATGLWRLLRGAMGDAWDSATPFYAGTVALVAMVLTGGAIGAVPAFQSEQFTKELSPDIVRLTWDAQGLIFTLIGAVGVLVVGGIAISILRTRALPAWLGWLGVLVTAAQAVSALGIVSDDLYKAGLFIGFLPFLVFVVATSVVLLTGDDRA